MKLSFSATVVLFAGSAWAQTNPFYSFQPLGQVKQFLQLSDSQLQTILTNNDDYNRWSAEKQSRIRQVQSELADETAKAPLEPYALGIRYAEIETICRQMKERANEYRTRNIDALNQDQKAKLKVLEDAMKLAPIISEAQYGNLAGGLTSAPYAFSGTSTSIGGSVIGAIIGPVNGCYLPFPVGVVRTGGFTSGPNLIPPSRMLGATPNAAASQHRWFNTTNLVSPK